MSGQLMSVCALFGVLPEKFSGPPVKSPFCILEFKGDQV